MHFTDLFIKKQVLAIALSFAILLTGLIAFHRLPLREFPVIDVPVITITTNYPGASPELMESFVSTPLQQAISGTNGIDYMTAANTQGSSVITIWLDQDYSTTKALTEINSKVSSVLWKLPAGIYNPIITSGTMGAPILYINFGSNTSSEATINDYLTRIVNPIITAVPGVQSIRDWGDTYAMRIWLDPRKMASKHLTSTDVISAIQQNSLQAPVGKLRGRDEDFDLDSNSSLNNAQDFSNLFVKKVGNELIRIKDIGSAKLGVQVADIKSHVLGYKHSIIIAVIVQPTTNDISVANQILNLLPLIKSKLPSDIDCNVLWNPTKFSSEAIDSVFVTIWLATLFVVIIIFAFLGSFRALLTPLVTIPLSLIGVCTFMLMLGYSLNTLTLLAFVLAIGLVVDDAIVVLENIHRHMHDGKAPIPAAIEAAREIAAPVIAMTLVVAIVFLPIAFTTGITGALFREFGLTLSLAVVLSGLFSLMLTPMMCSRLLKIDTSEKSLAHRIDRYCDSLQQAYRKVLLKIIDHRYKLLVVVGVILCLCVFLFKIIPSELLPDQDQGVILGIGIAPTSASPDYMIKYGNEMSNTFAKVPEMDNFGLVTGFQGQNSVITFLVMRDHKPGDRSEDEIIQSLRAPLGNIPGIIAFPMNRPPLAGVVGLTSPVQFVLQSTGTYENLYKTMNQLMSVASKNPNLMNLQTDLYIDKPEIKAVINREKAAWLGISVADITQTLNIMLSEPVIGWFDMNGLSYPIISQVIPQLRKLPNNLNNIMLRTSSGSLVPIYSVVDFKEITAPQSLNQFQQLRSATLSANLAHGYTLDQALSYLRTTTDKIITKNMKYDYAGTSREYVKASGLMQMIFVSVLTAIYLLLTMKFNNFMDPLIVMFSVPLSITGALAAMHWAGFTLNIYTQIGLVMLVGLISKHGILIVDFANHLQEHGQSIHDAAVNAAAIRLRPILMTTGAMIFGAVPLALAQGDGHETLQQIGLVIVGGLSFGSLLTLFVVPTMYTFLATKRSVEEH